MQAVMFLLRPIPQAPVDNFFGIFWYTAGFRILAQDVVVTFVLFTSSAKYCLWANWG
jgi:hypothetical protein